jgi:hypothetical protein
MVNPIRQRRDYASTARRLFTVDPLPEGASPVYDSDAFTRSPLVGFTRMDYEQALDLYRDGLISRETLINRLPVGVGIPEEADTAHDEAEAARTQGAPPRFALPPARRVVMPTFEIQSNPRIPMADVVARRFDMIESATQTLFPRWAVMGAWARHNQSGVLAQVIDAKDARTAVLELWEGHEVIPAHIEDDNTKVLPEGLFHVNTQGIQNSWSQAEEPQEVPTVWDHLDQDWL